jgi:hypothetical protein
MSSTNTKIAAISVCKQARIPFMMWDKPGTAKSRINEAIDRALGYKTETFIASIHEPPDCGGYPVPMNGRLQFLPAPFVYRALANAEKGLITAIFFDEFSCAGRAMQAALLRPILEGWFGDIQLPEEYVCYGAAANPPDSAADGHEMSAPAANRFCHIKWDLELKVWAEGMLSGFKDPQVPILPKNWEKEIVQARAMIISFVQALPNNFHTLNATNGGEAWASPRTLDMASRLLAASRSLGNKDTSSLSIELLSGCIGEGVTRELVAYVADKDLPNPEDLIKDPKKFKPSNRGDVNFAIFNSVVAAVLANNTVERWKNGLRVLAIGCDHGCADISTTIANILVERDNHPKGLKTSDIIPELGKFQKILKEAGLA